MRRAREQLTARDPDTEAALAELLAAREVEPRNVHVRLLLAEVYERTGKAAETHAIPELKDALRLVPTDRDLRLALLRQHLILKSPDYAAALQLLKEAQADPVLAGDPTWLREEGRLWAARGKQGPALTKMREALALSPGDEDLRRKLLDTLLTFRQYDAAVAEAEATLNPAAAARELNEALAQLRAKQAAGAAVDTGLKQKIERAIEKASTFRRPAK